MRGIILTIVLLIVVLAAGVHLMRVYYLHEFQTLYRYYLGEFTTS